jgi:hypothetical protein
MLRRTLIVAPGMAALWLCLGALPGCGVLGFDVEERIPPQEVKGSPLGGLLPLGLFQVPLQVDLEARTKAQGTGPAQAAHLKALHLQIGAPPGATFDFIDTLVITVGAEGLPVQEVARLPGGGGRGARLDLEVVDSVDLLPYLKKGATLRASATGRMPSRDVTFDGAVVVRVKV